MNVPASCGRMGEGGEVAQGRGGRWGCKGDDVSHWRKEVIGQGTPPFGSIEPRHQLWKVGSTLGFLGEGARQG